MKINIEMFHRWKNDDPVTLIFLKHLENVKSVINANMTDENLVRSNDAQLQLWELLGKRIFIDDILDLKFSDLEGVDYDDAR